MCEAAREASELGKVGNIVAKAASSNAAGWLSAKYGDFEDEIERAGFRGSEGQDCKKTYYCGDVSGRESIPYYLFGSLANNLMDGIILTFTYFQESLGR